MKAKSKSDQDWPDDPENDELARLAAQIEDAVPSLPAEALARVGQQMHAALDRAERRSRWQRVLFAGSIAAAVLLSISGYLYLQSSRSSGLARQPLVKAEEPPPVLIEDRIRVAINDAGRSPATEKPLIRLDDYRSLFAD